MIVRWTKLGKEIRKTEREEEARMTMKGESWRRRGGKEEYGEDGPDNMGRGETTRRWSKEKQAMWTRPAAGCVHNNNLDAPQFNSLFGTQLAT
jgi:hypothetical protein